MKMYGFGYDPVSENYKVVAVLGVRDYRSGHLVVDKD